MEDKGKGKMKEESSSRSRMDKILGFITRVDDDFSKMILEDIAKEKEKIHEGQEEEDYEERRDKKILDFMKKGLSDLEGVEYYVQREVERLCLNLNTLPEGLSNDEVEMPAAASPEADDDVEKVDGSCSFRAGGFFIGNTHIPKRKRTPGSCFTSVIQKVADELPVVHGRDPQYYAQQKKNNTKVRKPPAQRNKKKIKVRKPRPAEKQIPAHIEEKIREYGVTDKIMWVSEKELTDSDVRKNQNRLLLPSDCHSFLDRIMTDDEKRELFKSSEKRLHSELIDQDGRVWDMDLRYWPASNWIVFTGNWNNFVKGSVLVPNTDILRIWCFRAPDHGLCFAINIAKPAPARRVAINIAAPARPVAELEPAPEAESETSTMKLSAGAEVCFITESLLQNPHI